MGNFDFSKVFRAALFGGGAGFLAFLIQEPRLGAYERTMNHDPAIGIANVLVMFATLSLLISAALVLAEELSSLSTKRILIRLAIGLLAGGICGAIAGLMGQMIFSAILPSATRDILPNLGALMTARILGWAIVGAGIGVAGGLPSGSWRKCLQGSLGGLIGGAIGGFLFDVIGIPFGGGGPSRMVGDVAIGCCVGAAVMIIEEAAKVAWVTVVAGRNEGKQYILSKSTTAIGRDELSDIPLYGDMNVAKRHAVIQTADRKVFVFGDLGSQAGSGINGQRVSQATLSHGDYIQIGSFQLIFSLKALAGAAYRPYPIPPGQYYPPGYGQPPAQPYQQPYGPPPPQPYQPQGPSVCPYCGQYPDPATGACACTPVASQGGTQVMAKPVLVGIAGPYSGTTFSVDGDRIEIGRDPSNGVALDRDGGVSRKHAFLTVENGRLMLHDAGSTNGTFVNGMRIGSAALNPGDIVHFGSSSFRYGG